MKEERKKALAEKIGKAVTEAISDELREAGIKEHRFEELLTDPIFVSINLTGPLAQLTQAVDMALLRCGRSPA